MSIRTFIMGPLPPPVHGMSKNTKIIADAVRERVACTVIDLSSGSLDRGRLRYHLRRIRAVLGGMRKLLSEPREKREVAYIAADSGWGMVYTLLLLAFAHMRGCKLVVHHRSFRYIDRKSALMTTISKLVFTRGMHVFLCQKMKALFSGLYPVGASIVVSNARYVEVLDRVPPRPARPITIGLLSNLCYEKGLHDFVDLMVAAKAAGVAIKGILAGPASTENDLEFIKAAIERHGGDIEYRGGVYAGEKAKFYRDIDAFIFPTRYHTEAQPNVLFEALAHARPVISFDRGCIGPDIRGAGVSIPRGDGFVAGALPAILRWAGECGSLLSDQEVARAVALEHRTAAETGHLELVAALTS